MFYLSEPVDNSWNTWYREIGNPVYYMKKWSGTMENSVKKRTNSLMYVYVPVHLLSGDGNETLLDFGVVGNA